MKISTLKKMVVTCSLFLFMATSVMALDHGSMKAEGLPLYEQGSVGGNTASTVKAATLDIKVVTIGDKTWAWNKSTSSFIDTGADWCSQLRYWNSSNGKTENNMTNRNATANKADEVWIKTSTEMPSPLRISFFQNLVTGGQSETEIMDYDSTVKNSIIDGDVTAPSITTCSASDVAESIATINISGNEGDSDVFYYIVGNGIEEVSFSNTCNLTGLIPDSNYTLTVTPVDFSGNEGTPETVNFTTAGMQHITSGVAKDIKFVLKSTGTELEYYYELTDPSNKFQDAFLKITPAGGAEFELKPTISPDGLYAYGKVNDARIANKILSLNCGYLIYEDGGPVWENYVIDNTVITDGALSGVPIKHQMGLGINDLERESTNPVLNNVEILDVTADYIIIKLDGSDDSGTVYYEIKGAKEQVNAFRSGSYYLTAIETGKVYDLSVVAKDLSGNSSEVQALKVKTAKSRGNIADNENLGYNSLVKPGATGGELTTIIKHTDNSLTIGVTTNDSRYVGKPFYPKEDEASAPTIKINGIAYKLDRTAEEEGEAELTSASITFNGTIGEGENEIMLEPGTLLKLQWSVFWSPSKGNFFTETFNYVIGDNGQEDTDAPAKPVLTLNGNVLTWPACTDLLSGVKHYRVVEEMFGFRAIVNTVIIPDLGEETFSYTLSDLSNLVTVTAVDFEGNEMSEVSTNSTVGVASSSNDIISVYPNPATEIVNISGDVAAVVIYSLQGQQVYTKSNSNSINVSALNEGLYLLQITDKLGIKQSVKLQIKK